MWNKVFVYLYDVFQPKEPQEVQWWQCLLWNDSWWQLHTSLWESISGFDELSIGDEIWLFYDPNASCFMFELIYKAISSYHKTCMSILICRGKKNTCGWILLHWMN